MHFPSAALLVAVSLLPAAQAAAAATFSKSDKRGLVFVPSTKHPEDNQVWVQSGSDLTWYYNYGVQPSSAFASTTQDDFEFVPMLWGTSNTFLADIKALVAGGRNISHVMAFNEPDGTSSTGGSNIDPTAAAATWIEQIEPLRAMGIKTGAPAVTGAPGGFTWLSEFFASCASRGTNCTADFIPVHWYGNFEGLASHLGQVWATYPNISTWITEYAFNDQSLETSQVFFSTSAQYFDRVPNVGRYSYFGSFRSDVSNVGTQAAMLTEKGELTDIGSWYLGGSATGNVPSTKKSGASKQIITTSSVVLAAGITAFLML